MDEKATNCFDATLEAGSKHVNENDDTLLANRCKLEMEIETYDEFCNPDARSIYFEQSNRSMVKVERTCPDSPGSDTYSATHVQDKSNKSIANSNVAFKEHPNIKQFNCDKCSYVGKIKAHFIRHQKVHIVERLKCRECSYVAKTKANLTRHQLKHSNARPFKCVKCSYMAKRKQALRNHQQIHTNVRLFECEKCSYKATRKIYLRRHQIVHNRLRLLRCDKCSFWTWKTDCLKTHKQLHRPHKYDRCNNRNVNNISGDNYNVNKKNISQTREDDNKQVSENENEQSLIEKECKIVMEVAARDEFLSDVDVKSISSGGTQIVTDDTILVYNKVKFNCDKCDYAGETQHGLTIHQITHTNVRPFKCNKCSYRAKTKNVLKNHQLVHTNKRPYKCDNCNYSAKMKSKNCHNIVLYIVESNHSSVINVPFVHMD